MNRMGYVCVLVAISATACQREDPRLGELTARLEKLEKRVDVVEKRPAGAPQRPQRKMPDPAVTYNLPIDDSDVASGPKNAKVTIVTGTDYACPWCALSHPAIDEVAKKYPTTVRVVSKQYIIHPDVAALPAYATCAARNQGKGAEFEAKTWAKAWKIEEGRPKMDAVQLKQESLEAVAKEVGVDLVKWKADTDSQGCKDWVARQQKELATIGVNGTPAFYINGKPYAGQRTVEGFSAAIDEELKKADAALGSGVKLEDYYATLMKTAQKSL